MRILYVVPYVPNLIRTRPYNLIRHLAKLHDVTVVTAWTDRKELEAVRALRLICTVRAAQLTRRQSLTNTLRHLPTKIPLQAYYCWSPAVAGRIDELVKEGEQFDAVHVEHLRGVPYALHWLKLAQRHSTMRHVPLIWDSVDCISYLFRQASEQGVGGFGRFVTRFDLHRTERFEGQMVRQLDHTVVTSRLDKEALIELAGPDSEPRISVVPNGVDLDYFMPDQTVAREPRTVVVTGKMSYHANIAMVTALIEQVMPHVWAHHANVRVQIVGKEPPSQIQAYASMYPNVEVTGAVDDLRPYLQKATVAVAPVQYGAGIQNKVLEAMACGTPTVASEKAVAAIDIEPWRDLLVGGNSAEIGVHINALLDDAAFAQKIGRAGRVYVERNHNWFGAAAQLARIYQQVGAQKREERKIEL